MKNEQKSLNKSKHSLKLFGFITLFSVKQRNGKAVYYVLGLPVWKIRRMENDNMIKYYLFGIPLLRSYYPSIPVTEKILKQQTKIETAQQTSAAEFKKINDRLLNLEKELQSSQKLFTDKYSELTDKQKQLFADCHRNTEQVQNNDDRLRVYHAELLERLDNLPKKM